jgi:hypothetical protein
MTPHPSQQQSIAHINMVESLARMIPKSTLSDLRRMSKDQSSAIETAMVRVELCRRESLSTADHFEECAYAFRRTGGSPDRWKELEHAMLMFQQYPRATVLEAQTLWTADSGE